MMRWALSAGRKYIARWMACIWLRSLIDIEHIRHDDSYRVTNHDRILFTINNATSNPSLHAYEFEITTIQFASEWRQRGNILFIADSWLQLQINIYMASAANSLRLRIRVNCCLWTRFGVSLQPGSFRCGESIPEGQCRPTRQICAIYSFRAGAIEHGASGDEKTHRECIFFYLVHSQMPLTRCVVIACVQWKIE